MGEEKGRGGAGSHSTTILVVVEPLPSLGGEPTGSGMKADGIGGEARPSVHRMDEVITNVHVYYDQNTSGNEAKCVCVCV